MHDKQTAHYSKIFLHMSLTRSPFIVSQKCKIIQGESINAKYIDIWAGICTANIEHYVFSIVRAHLLTVP